jgi:pyruvate dehydrogenase E2 component (dihydrolipoamide acetyltransferase)
MTSEVVMPRLGWTMEVGQVVEWLKHDGDLVEAGEAIFAVEADKGVTDVEALESGVLRIPPDSPIGVEVPVGERLAFIVPSGEAPPFQAAASATHDPIDASASVEPRPVAVNGPHDAPARVARDRDGMPPISPRARRRADEEGIDWTVLSGSGSSGRIIERDVAAGAARAKTSSLRAGPAVRRLAEDRGVDLGQAPTSGPSRRVTGSAIRAAAKASPPLDRVADQSMPQSRIRWITAQRMAESARTVAPVTLTTEADATELVQIRGHLRDELVGTDDPTPSFTDLLVRFVALALTEHPALNASVDGDQLVQRDAIHVGIAVDTERGLVVPIVRDADRKSVHAIAMESAEMVVMARGGTITTDHLSGGTFTITNLGMYDIDAFTPIINLPECAILGVGRIVARPVVIDVGAETVTVRKMISLSLTFDHRVVDGAPAARFLQRIKQMIERPYVWLMR